MTSTNTVNRFYKRIKDSANQNQSTLIGLFVHFLTEVLNQDAATPRQVSKCFRACDLTEPKSVSARLSEGVKSKPAKYIKVNGGYKLERHWRQTLSKKLEAERQITIQTSETLRGLVQEFKEGKKKEFLKETIDCFEVGAKRATIIMAWILTLNQLFDYIIRHKLQDFNTSLKQARGVKLKVVKQRDDFSDLKESQFIQICRAAKIISNDVYKILVACLNERNTCAHPSDIKISKTKVIAHVEDLVTNVVCKYEV
ncbi:MAG: hypothetical protein OXG88_03670 [Gammaproteobacteria bacterium]|nr:hypothetical protein [Gammaproteobacteria bacterium]